MIRASKKDGEKRLTVRAKIKHRRNDPRSNRRFRRRLRRPAPARALAQAAPAGARRWRPAIGGGSAVGGGPCRPRRGRRRLRLRAESRHHVGPAALVALDLDQPVRRRVFQQFAEGAVAVVVFVERRLLALHRVLDHRRPQHFLVLAAQGQQRFEQQREGLLLGLRQLRLACRGRSSGPGPDPRSR